MNMTQKQKDFLDSFTCQRLTADTFNKILIRKFTCKRNPRLAAYLHELAWEEDQDGAASFYVIKNQKDQVVFFFSLKCGALFEPLDIESLRNQLNDRRKLLDAISNYRRGLATDEELAAIEQKMQEYGMSVFELQWTLRDEVSEKNQKLSDAMKDFQDEHNPNISQVIRTYPAVELMHFCGRDGNKEAWKKYKSQYGFPPDSTMGQVMFWYFVAPILLDISQVLGCQYAYLFAADSTLKRELIIYYNGLNFYSRTDLGTSKPRYDFTCEFMCQTLRDMKAFRDKYLENFNPDPGKFDV